MIAAIEEETTESKINGTLAPSDSINKVTGHSTAQEMRAASDDQMLTNIKCNRGPDVVSASN
jgi:hypothetical protein